MDIFLLQAAAEMLNEALRGAQINKVHQPCEDTLVLRLWTRGRDQRLLLSTATTGNRFGLCDQRPANPFAPPRFCQLLRSRLRRLEAIEPLPGERVLRLLFVGENDRPYTLVAEFFGRQGNMALLDEGGMVVDLLYRRRAGGGRMLQVGQPYLPPESGGRCFLGDGLPEIPAACDDPAVFRSYLMERVCPMSPAVATDLARGVESGLSPGDVLTAFADLWRDQGPSPGYATINGRERLLPFAPFYSDCQQWRPIPPEELIRAGAAEAPGEEQQVVSGEEAQLAEAIKKGRKRLRRRLENIKRQEEDASAFEQRKNFGDLLLSNLHLIRKGMEQIDVEDYFQSPPVPVAIALDKTLTPQENAQAYFTRYKKGKRGVVHVARRLEETQQELDWLEQAALALDEAHGTEEIAAIHNEFEEAGMLPARKGPSHPKGSGGIDRQLRRALSPSGYQLIWGKSPRTNDHVSRRLTAAGDLWFHAHNLPGCHLVLKKEGQAGEVPEEDLLFAASLAAGYSRAKNDLAVEVMVAEGRQVKKPKGARPGLVTVNSFRTLRVRPRRMDD